MSRSSSPSKTTTARLEAWRRGLGRWWRRQPPNRQDRFVMLGPLFTVLLFLTAMAASFWYLRAEEIDHENAAVARAGELVQQQLRLRLLDHEEQLLRVAREVATRDIGRTGFVEQASTLSSDRPEWTRLMWLGPNGAVRAQLAALPFDDEEEGESTPPAAPPRLGVAAQAALSEGFAAVGRRRQVVYTRAFENERGTTVFRMMVPILSRSEFSGALAAEIDLDRFLRRGVPSDITKRYALSVVDDEGRVLTSLITPMKGQSNPHLSATHELPLAPLDQPVFLRTQGGRPPSTLIGSTLFSMVVALSALTVWMLLGSWRHLRRRNQIQATLMQETNFRRAMEDSILTGMRAMDLDGRITYANRAFCEMTGFTEQELIGCLPPYPYWLPDRIDDTMRYLEQELQGKSPAGGIEVRVRRKDGEVFDARMYVSPLVDHRGEQTGWMTSMTNITEAKRVRDQLAASHERFTTVLEGLDAAVSVIAVQGGELLFANRSYRLWFGGATSGHLQLADNALSTAEPPAAPDDPVDNLSGLPTESLTEAGAQPTEVFIEALQKWFDVRSRYLQWTDGRLAQMLIATDITARRRAEEANALQAEKAQVTSRLVTMGEMASSVAHELNQPLTAITNYCQGVLNRLRGNGIEREDLVSALEKTSRQAERAGQIIHRIRSFVKRSEPQRQPSSAQAIVEDAVELAQLDLRRRRVQLHTYIAKQLPTLMCDPILVEQVVLNLVKNAAEAIDHSDMPSTRRRIELRVVPRQLADQGSVVEFSITDTGPGMAKEVLDRIYEAFFSTKREGMGIGLSLCRSIIESHQGRMSAENLYNGDQVAGSRFSFTLPIQDPRSAHARDPRATSNSLS